MKFKPTFTAIGSSFLLFACTQPGNSLPQPVAAENPGSAIPPPAEAAAPPGNTTTEPDSTMKKSEATGNPVTIDGTVIRKTPAVKVPSEGSTP